MGTIEVPVQRRPGPLTFLLALGFVCGCVAFWGSRGASPAVAQALRSDARAKPTVWNFAAEGRVAVPGGHIWYGVVGERRGAAPPIIFVHGGPGLSHWYLYPLTALADTHQLIFYDQLDAGQSEWPNDPKNWIVPRYCREIDALRAHLELETVVVFGNSWGGTVAAAYAATRPVGLVGLVLSGPLLDTPAWLADNAAYRAALPGAVQDTLDACDASGAYATSACAAAVDVFYKRHLCRLTPWPDFVERTFDDDMFDARCYHGMWGPDEFEATGILRSYDGSAALANISVPTLLTCGEFDEATPATTRRFASYIPGSEFAVFPNASHFNFVEVPGLYLPVLRRFLEERVGI